MKASILKFDRILTRWVAATFGQSARPFFEVMTMLGDPAAVGLVTIGVIILGFYTSNMQLAISGAVIPATVVAGALLKLGFERARPLTEYAMNMRMKTFSFPSGHSSGSTVTYGTLAFLVLQLAATPWTTTLGFLLLTLPVFVGISRVYLGAHFPSDVIAGWLLGIAGVGIVIYVIRPML